MGITHFDKICGVRGVYVGATGKEEPLAKITHVAESFTVDDMTAAGVKGTYTLKQKLPVGAIPLGWAFRCTGAFTGDVSAAIRVGIAADDDRFSADTTGSVFAEGLVGSLAVVADACKGISAEVAVLVTITSATDFDAVVTDGTGAGTLYLFYGEL